MKEKLTQVEHRHLLKQLEKIKEDKEASLLDEKTKIALGLVGY